MANCITQSLRQNAGLQLANFPAVFLVDFFQIFSIQTCQERVSRVLRQVIVLLINLLTLLHISANSYDMCLVLTHIMCTAS